MTTIAFYTLGCKANQYETDQMKEQILKAGFKLMDFNQPADIYIINTCTVTQVADKKSRQAIHRASRSGSKVMVTGCYAELEAEALAKIPGVSSVLKNSEKKNLVNYLRVKACPPCQPAKHSLAMLAGKARLGRRGQGSSCQTPQRIRANLMIEDGCQQFCSYCIVPYARGKIKSKPLPEILREAADLVSRGVREIVLTGINLGAYGSELRTSNGSTELAEVLEQVINKISEIKDLKRIRLSSLEPMFITKELIDSFAKNPKVCRHLHIPLQSGDNTILKRMNRNYTAEDFISLVNYIRSKIPGVAIATDVIVGFPGEGEGEFQNTVKLIKEIGFTRLHVFRYSKRKLTAASSFKDQIDPKIISKRSQNLWDLRNRLMLAFHSRQIGQTYEVLVEQKDKETGKLEGLTSNYIRVFFEGPDNLLGQLVPVKIKRAQIEFVVGYNPPLTTVSSYVNIGLLG